MARRGIGLGREPIPSKTDGLELAVKAATCWVTNYRDTIALTLHPHPARRTSSSEATTRLLNVIATNAGIVWVVHRKSEVAGRTTVAVADVKRTSKALQLNVTTFLRVSYANNSEDNKQSNI